MKRKTVVVNESGRLPEINITGPITKPTRIALPNIAKMVKSGKDVEECDPADPFNIEKRVKLTVENVGKDNFTVSVNTNSQKKKEDANKSNENPVKPDSTENQSASNADNTTNEKPQQNQTNNQKDNKKR